MKFALEFFVDVLFAEFVGHPNRVLYGVRVRSAVTDDTDALDAQQRGTPVFGIVHSAAELLKRLLGQNVTDLRRKRPPKLVPQHRRYRLYEALAQLERNVPRKTVADDHIHITLKNISALDVAYKVQRSLLESLEDFLRQLVAF